MNDEQILLCKSGQMYCRVDEIVIPDIRFQGLFLSRLDQEVLNYSYDSSKRIQEIIKERGEKQQFRPLEFQLPNLFVLSMRKINGGFAIPKGLRDEIIDFMSVTQALIRHLLPKTIPTVYGPARMAHGFQYKGFAWVAVSLNARGQNS